MDRIQSWKNVKLGSELHISGRFIYNGLHYFHEMETLYYEDEIFEVLYNLSVGLERLIKIAVILSEHDGSQKQDEFEKSLITHNHLELLKRLKVKYKLKITCPHNEFLQLLSNFYKSHRYGRFNIKSINTLSEEKLLFYSYLQKHLGIQINDEFSCLSKSNISRCKNFIGRIVGTVSTELFDIISEEANRLNIYTNEIRYNSKAGKIFLSKEFEFTNEDILCKELLIYFMNSYEIFDDIGFIKNIQPLDFDKGLIVDYLKCLNSDEKKLEHIDELETLYEEIENKRDRLKELSLIGDISISIDDNE